MSEEREGAGCAAALAYFNFLLMILPVLAFSMGPYSSWEQELWYRYGSLGFLMFGAILPFVALRVRLGRSQAFRFVLSVWMVTTLCAFIAYLMMSGGGV